MARDQKYLEIFEEIIGCDEAGRGPLAGPVIGCGLKLGRESKGLLNRLKRMGVSDSKKLTGQKRLQILEELEISIGELELNRVYQREYKKNRFEFVVTQCAPEEIDRLNILQASLFCMRLAASKLYQTSNSVVLVDGNKGFDFDSPVEPVVKGDQHFLSISLASIIAKEFRDEKMRALDLLYPGYGLAKHAGYPTVEHREAIKLLGVSPAHRKSFKGVKEHVGQ